MQFRWGGEEGTEFSDMLIHSSIANHYDSVGLGSLHATTQSESYLKVLKILEKSHQSNQD
jgi:hypothetical protein